MTETLGEDSVIDHYNEYNTTVYNLQKCVSFYRDKLGLEMKLNEEDYAYFTFGKTRMGLAWFPSRLPTRGVGG